MVSLSVATKIGLDTGFVQDASMPTLHMKYSKDCAQIH